MSKDDRELKFDNGWVEQTPFLARLVQQGYGVGGWISPETGKHEFWLTGEDGFIFETDDLNQLNAYVKLLIEKEK